MQSESGNFQRNLAISTIAVLLVAGCASITVRDDKSDDELAVRLSPASAKVAELPGELRLPGEDRRPPNAGL
ncbi:MAG TPA: hypothetical protein VFV70_00450 [Hyphomonadaceae bacterium]|nr:hypothetical protein [Hyphomonadaceae bacterium]